MKYLVKAIVFFVLVLPAFGQDVSNNQATLEADGASDELIHEQLRLLRERMMQAYEKRDVQALLDDVAPSAVITWQNGDRHLSHDEFLEFYEQMIGSEGGYVKELSSEFQTDGKSITYGDDTAVAFGTCTDHFVLADGNDFELVSQWTATIVRENNSWNVASFHMSASIFENPILAAAKNWLATVGVVAGIIGLIVGYLLRGMMAKKPTTS